VQPLLYAGHLFVRLQWSSCTVDALAAFNSQVAVLTGAHCVVIAALKLGGLRLASIIRAKPSEQAPGQLQGPQQEAPVVARIRATAAG
jgi:hypothetical protein